MDNDEMRQRELDKIERFAAKLEPKCEEGDVEALRVWSGLIERRAALLGLDQPRRQVQVLTNDVVEQALREATEELKRLQEAPLGKLTELRSLRERVAEAERLAEENGADVPKDASTD